MSCTYNNNMNNATTSSSSTTAVDDISNDIGKIDISKDVGDVSGIDTAKEEKMSNKKCTSCEQKVEHKTDGKQHNTTGFNNADIDMVPGDIVSDVDAKDMCANCGKEGASNTCNKCQQTKYCNAACKKKHRHKHKKDCEEHLRLVAELQEEENKRSAELYDMKLFKQPSQQEEDCPICFQRLPLLDDGKRYYSCCGKTICCGCIHAMGADMRKLCPFCRTPSATSDEESNRRMQKRVDIGDAEAMSNLAFYYSNGLFGLPQDDTKALQLFHRAAELGHVGAHHNIGCNYASGRGVDMDAMKAFHHWELAAMGGYTTARHYLGCVEQKAGYTERAIKHHIIAVEGGSDVSLRNIQELYSTGHVTKDDYAKALRAYQEYLVEVRSSQRDQAAAHSEDYKYI